MQVQIRYALVLLIVCSVAAASVAGIYALAKPNIEKNATKTIEDALRLVMPDAQYFMRITGPDAAGKTVTRYYIGMKELKAGLSPYEVVTVAAGGRFEGDAVGYAAIADSQGYSSRPSVMIATDVACKVLSRITVLSQRETPGLGTRCVEKKAATTWAQRLGLEKVEVTSDDVLIPWFQKQFFGKAQEELHLGRIQAISGATITSNAVTEAARTAWSNLKRDLIQDSIIQG